MAALRFKTFDGQEREMLVNPAHVVAVTDCGVDGVAVRLAGVVLPMEMSEPLGEVLRKLGAEVHR